MPHTRNSLNRHGHIERLLANFGAHVRPEYAALARRKVPLALSEFDELRGNSYEWRVLYANATDEAYIHHVLYNAGKCHGELTEYGVASTYDEALIGQDVHMLCERLRDANGFAYSIDPAAHPWIFGGDISGGSINGRWDTREDMFTDCDFTEVAEAGGGAFYVRHPGGKVERVYVGGEHQVWIIGDEGESSG